MPAPGERFGSWVVLGPAKSAAGHRMAQCACACGTVCDINLSDLIRGASTRCRTCGDRTPTPRGRIKHGAARGSKPTPEYRTWKAMIERCEDAKSPHYLNYGARGVRIAPEWRGLDGFARFLEHVGPRPSDKHSIDRFPVFNGNYEPGNVRWATAAEQNRNKGDTRLITFSGTTQCLTDWARQFGIRVDTLHGRLADGWSVERALTTPVGPSRRAGARRDGVPKLTPEQIKAALRQGAKNANELHKTLERDALRGPSDLRLR